MDEHKTRSTQRRTVSLRMTFQSLADGLSTKYIDQLDISLQRQILQGRTWHSGCSGELSL